MLKNPNLSYDIAYLKEEDIESKKPNMAKIRKVTPYFEKDLATVFALCSAQQEAPEEVKEYYRNKAQSVINQDIQKYSHLLEVMETKDYSQNI